MVAMSGEASRGRRPPKPKQAVALVIWELPRGRRLLVVRRPDAPGEELPGIWGLPAGSRRPGESLAQVALRVGRDKLDVPVKLGRWLARGRQVRQGYGLEMALVEAAIEPGHSPRLPKQGQRSESVTCYTACRWAGPEVLEEGARRGSLCCQLLLQHLRGARREKRPGKGGSPLAKPEEEEKAVVEGVEGDQAILLVGNEERRLVVPWARLPAGARAGAWLRLVFQDGEITDLRLDEGETQRRLRRVQAKLAALRARGGGKAAETE